MRRTVGFIVGGLAVASLALTGCNSSSDSDEASPENVAEAGDFCQQAKDMSDRYLAAIQEQIAKNATPDAAAQKELTDQVVTDLKTLEANMPDSASEEVKTAFGSAITNLESGAAPSEQSTKDDELVSTYMASECPNLNPSAEANPSTETIVPEASPSN